jgi:geranylgeranyl reductase family protein
MLDAIVVGAGPGGSAAAYHLARRGRSVLLIDAQQFPRDKSCGDGLTRPAVAALAEMGVLPQIDAAQHVYGVRVRIRGQGSREYRYPEQRHGIVMPRLALDDILCRRAVEAGAELREGLTATRLLYADGIVCGVEVSDGVSSTAIHASVVLAADGAASALARQAGLLTGAQLGFAIRGYYTGIGVADAMLEIELPLLDPTDRYLLPSYGWVFPTGTGTANIGVGLFRRERRANLRVIMQRFVDELRRRDRRFADMRLTAAWKGAPLRFDFAPDRCAAPGLLLVGDAAGLISPFTGEGISYALESGRYAAEVADDALTRGDLHDLAAYGRRLGMRFAGYFELGRESAKRYTLLWQVLQSTFGNDKPLFAMTRQAALFPEGVGEADFTARLPDVRAEVGSLAPALRADIAAAGDLLADTVRRDWPFLARVAAVDMHDPAIRFRPALLLLLSASCAGSMQPHAPALAAVVELGYLATLAHLSVVPDAKDTVSDRAAANWGNMFAVIVGDFLLAHAYHIGARSGAAVTAVIAHSLAAACESRVREMRHGTGTKLTPTQYEEIALGKTGALFELPCLLGARLAGMTVAETDALGGYGRHFGAALQIAEDVRNVAGGTHEFSLSTGTDVEDGLYGLPLLLALQHPDVATELRSLLASPRRGPRDQRRIAALLESAGALDAAFVVARTHVERASALLERLPASLARDALRAVADRIVVRGGPTGSVESVLLSG